MRTFRLPSGHLRGSRPLVVRHHGRKEDLSSPVRSVSPEGTAEGVTTIPLHLFRPFNHSPLSQHPPHLPPLLPGMLRPLFPAGQERFSPPGRVQTGARPPSPFRQATVPFSSGWLGLELRSGPAAAAAGDWERRASTGGNPPQRVGAKTWQGEDCCEV